MTSPVPLQRLQREPLLFRPEPRHFEHFFALITVINMSLSEAQEYTISLKMHNWMGALGGGDLFFFLVGFSR